MKHNIVFLPIGDSSCGDAIAIRLWDGEDIGTQRIVIIDGGYKDDWQKVRDLVQDNFGAKWIDLVISTHPDQDHIGGLTGVVENLTVKQLWMHLPWNHSDEYLTNRQDEFRSMTATNWLKNSLNASNDLQLAAEANNVPIEEPFAGKQFITPYGTLTVLSPSVDFYEALLPLILDKSAEKSQRLQTASTLTSLSELFGKAKDAVMNAIESHHIETLTNSGSTSPSNNSSTIMLLELVSGKKLLFTGDAGQEALNLAHDNFVALGHRSGELGFVQVPHHGSRQNVGPDVLDKFLGTKTPQEDTKRGTAYVSAAANCTKDGHPKKSVTNAFRRRGYPVFQTGNGSIKHGHELDGFSGTVYPLPLFSEVEGD
ncbi:MBL fold metallo-hydrolase [Candidatus Saccharibacteria bacterium]|nr:MBL fold metallo-hydrolase [Candidatus Saccharibacteria bacterium]